ncbi:hypothetical protein GCM10025868_06830 [Angustibacter aerolatus]|uniref:ATPase AAA-3 domain-containing protein n=1 Tax=Angustibacter aerolatus TaxID=1162965 RepID=A0ABQ6JB83_9ACTN|nr:hypothetical protein GCM10025868_06830 [Angustibacter aerolatus]
MSTTSAAARTPDDEVGRAVGQGRGPDLEGGPDTASLADLQATAFRIGRAIETVIEGKPDVVRTALTVLLAEGHLLIEDVPGVGKTMLAKALARAVDCSVRRIQFTPDLLPSDVTGVSIYNQDQRDFEFKPGAVFANVVLGDEINRASPKTQSALLECMEERQVTVDGVTYGLEAPFIVVATQNPIEMEGTYPLPEAQRDRFMARLSMGYPSSAEARHAEQPRLGHAARPGGAGRVGSRRARAGAHRAGPLGERRGQAVRRRPGHRDAHQPRPAAGRLAARHPAGCCGPRARTPRSRAATTCCRTTCRRWPWPCSPTGCCSRRTRCSRGAPPRTSSRPCCARSPCRARRTGRTARRRRAASDAVATRTTRVTRRLTEPLGRLTSRGRAVLAAGLTAVVCALALGQRDLLRVGVLLALVPVLTVVVLGRTRYRLACTRTVSPLRVEVGAPAQVVLEVANVSGGRCGLVLAEEEVPYGLGTRPRFVLPGLEPGERRAIAYPVRSPRRGRYAVGPLSLTLTDPFGMGRHRRSFTSRDLLVVTPAVVRLPRIALAGDWNGSGDTRPRSVSATGEDDVTTREYHQGDDLRRVHWRSTARRGEPHGAARGAALAEPGGAAARPPPHRLRRRGRRVDVRVGRVGRRLARRAPGRARVRRAAGRRQRGRRRPGLGPRERRAGAGVGRRRPGLPGHHVARRRDRA